MRHTTTILIFLLVCCLAPRASSAQDERSLAVTAKETDGRRVALVIGNAGYDPSPLRNPANDARDMAATLEALGFEVTLLVDADEFRMAKSITGFGRQLGPNDVGLFFFAGHGMQIGGRNYLIPVGAGIQEEDEIPYKAIDAGLVLQKMESAGNSVNIVILDACRNNPFARSFRSMSQGLARMDAPSGSLIVYATAPGDVAADGRGRNGLFTENLLKYIAAQDVDVEVMLKSVRKAVFDQTKGKQTPWTSSSLRGAFYFRPGTGQPAVPALAPVPVAPAAPLPPGRAPAPEATTLSVSASGSSGASDQVARLVSSRDAALKNAYKILEKKLKAAPYNLSSKEIRRIFDNGELVDLEYEDDGGRAVIQYQVLLPQGPGK